MLTKSQKQSHIDKMCEEMKAAKSVAFADYTGLTVAQMTEIRRNLRQKNIWFKVYKKTLIWKAWEKIFWINIDLDSLPWQIVVIYSNNEINDWPRTVKEISKKNKKIKLVWWIFESKFLDNSSIIELADLPTKEELLSRLLWAMTWPVRWFMWASNWVIWWFVRILDQYKDKK